jgi:hypothetical protein
MAEQAVANDPGESSAPLPLSEVLAQASDGFGQKNFDLPINFSFKWNDLTATVAVANGPGQATMRMAVDLGAIPYSAENSARRLYLKQLANIKLPLKDCWFSTASGNRLSFDGSVGVESPLTGKDIACAVVRLLIPAQPYLFLALGQPPAIEQAN